MSIVIPARTRSSFSFGRGASHVEDLVAAAKNLGLPGIGLADRHTVAGHVRFATACKAAGLTPMFGAELLIAPDATKRADGREGWVAVFAQNERGFRNLTTLLAATPLGQRTPIPLPRLLEANEGLLVLSGNIEDGLLPRLLAADGTEARRILARLREAFGDRLYIEIERQGKHDRGSPIEAALLDLAYAPDTACPLIATTPIWFATPDRSTACRLARAIASGRPVALLPDGELAPPTGEERSGPIPAPDAAGTLFEDLPEAVRNAADILARCHYAPTPRPPSLPALSLAGSSPEEALREACRQGLEERMRAHAPAASRDAYDRRLAHEIEVITKTGFASYFLIVAEFVTWARSRDIPVGPGRGSGVGSLAAWALGITEIDPLRHGLLFERFLNPERVSLPDFDIDFCERRRGEVLRHVVETYGEDRVAAISTFAEIKVKSALKDVARAIVHPDGSTMGFQEINAITRIIPSGPDEPRDVEDALARFPALREATDRDPRLAAALRLSSQILGLYRQSGLHAAGVIIADRPLADLAAVHPPPDDKATKLPQLGLDMTDAEKIGLVKFDFLGLSTTTLIRDAEAILEATGRDRPDWSRLDRDDPTILRAFAAGETFGVFQFESAGMRSALAEVRPERFSDLVAINALFRPGPIKYIQEFARRKAGLAEFSYPEPRAKTEPILRDTYGIMVYQEQVMEMARACAGYSLGAADILRRAMGKKKPEEMARQKAIFLDGDGKDIPGAVALGLDRQDAERLFEDMASFAGYGFNKSHAVAYSDLAWRAMWLKINHPDAFYCALLNLHLSETEKLNAIREDMLTRGLRILPPDIERSLDIFTVEYDDTGRPALRFGLAGVRNLSDLSDFLARRDSARREGPNALPRLIAESLNSRQIENLAAAGTFDAWLPNRRQAVEAILALKTARAAPAQPTLLGTEEPDWRETLPPNIRGLPDWEDREEREIRATGMTFGIHPVTANKDLLFKGGVRRLASYLDYMRRKGLSSIRGAKLAFLVNGCVARTVGKSGEPMLTISAAEETDRYELAAYASSTKMPLDRVRTIVETARKLREPVVAEVNLSVDARTGKPTIKVLTAEAMGRFLLTIPGFFLATLPADTGTWEDALTPLSASKPGPHRLLVARHGAEVPERMIEGVDPKALAALMCRQDVELRRLAEEEWETLTAGMAGAGATPVLAA